MSFLHSALQSPSLYARKSKGIFYGIFLKSRLYILPGMTFRELHLPFLENKIAVVTWASVKVTLSKIQRPGRFALQSCLKLMQSAVTSGSAALIGLSKNSG